MMSPAGFTEHVTGYHKFSLTDYTVTQAQLMDKCSTDYGHRVHLLALETEEEMNHIKDIINDSGKSIVYTESATV